MKYKKHSDSFQQFPVVDLGFIFVNEIWFGIIVTKIVSYQGEEGIIGLRYTWDSISTTSLLDDWYQEDAEDNTNRNEGVDGNDDRQEEDSEDGSEEAAENTRCNSASWTRFLVVPDTGQDQGCQGQNQACDLEPQPAKNQWRFSYMDLILQMNEIVKSYSQ